MALNKRVALAKFAVAIAVLSLFATAAPRNASAQLAFPVRADPFSALVGRRAPAAERAAAASAVERFAIASDDRVFLFQQRGSKARLKYLCGDGDKRLACVIDPVSPAEEIHVLEAVRASRGDVIWQTPEGDTLLRVGAYGGVTVFWPGDPRGYAAAKSFGEDPPLTLEFQSIETARARAQTATAIVSARVGAPIVFDIGDPGPDAHGGASVLADAVVRAADGIASVSRDQTGARVLAARIEAVRFRPAPEASVGMDKGVLTVGYDPSADIDGRPSSIRVARFLEDSL